MVTGVPSVEYGDLSNGVVKVNTRRGKSPFIVEAKLNQNTRQVALSKGIDLGGKWGLFNFSMEHARTFGDITSPYTAYQRNVLSAHYMHVLMRHSMPLTLNIGLTGNVGGYNSKADPERTRQQIYRKPLGRVATQPQMAHQRGTEIVAFVCRSAIRELQPHKFSHYTSLHPHHARRLFRGQRL